MPFMSLKDAPKCSANKKKKNGGGKCSNPAMVNGKCRMHGGKTPKGLASPNLKTGAYSSYLPKNFFTRAQDFKADPALIELGEAVSVQKVRITELFQELGTREPVEVWRRLAKRYQDWQLEEKELEDAQKAYDMNFFENPAAQERAKARLEQKKERAAELHQEFAALLIDGCAAEEKAEIVWKKIEAAQERLRKLDETESKRLKDSGEYVSKEGFQIYNLLVQQIIIENVSDSTVRKAISEKLISAGLA